MTHFIRDGSKFTVHDSADISVCSDLPLGTYLIRKDPRTEEYYLVVTEDFEPLNKYYGDTQSLSKRILSTYYDRNKNTGVLLSGEKGSGKSLLAKLVSIQARQRNMPTIVINEPHFGDIFNKFVSLLNTPCVILFDEFEKVYSDSRHQSLILTLLDGGISTNHLFILTCNTRLGLNNHLLNRPGRIYYSIEYKGLDEDFILSYCKDNKLSAEHTLEVIKISKLFSEFNFDMLQALVEEHLRYGESIFDIMKFVNANPQNDVVTYQDSYKLRVLDPTGKNCEVSYPKTLAVNPLSTRQIVVELEDGGDDNEIIFVVSDMTVCNASMGKFEFKNNGGYTMFLERELFSNLDYKKLL